MTNKEKDQIFNQDNYFQHQSEYVGTNSDDRNKQREEPLLVLSDSSTLMCFWWTPPSNPSGALRLLVNFIADRIRQSTLTCLLRVLRPWSEGSFQVQCSLNFILFKCSFMKLDSTSGLCRVITLQLLSLQDFSAEILLVFSVWHLHLAPLTYVSCQLSCIKHLDGSPTETCSSWINCQNRLNTLN